MCNVSAKLIAWLDHELPECEAAEVGNHVQNCAECRGQVEMYAKMSREFDAYCDASTTPALQGRARRWVRALPGAAAAAAAIVLFLSLPRMHVHKPKLAHTPAAVIAQAVVSQAAPSFVKPRSVRSAHQRRAVPVQVQATVWQPAERTVEIAIPAESMYPPGAVPEGMSFVVDVRIAADGSAQQISLWP